MEEIKYSRTIKATKINGIETKKTIIQIIAKKGLRNYPFDKEGKDRLYFIRLIQEGKQIDFPYSHDNQITLLKLVLNNVIIDRVFRDDLGKFEKAIRELKEGRLKE